MNTADCIIMAGIISGSGECSLPCLVEPEFCWGDLNFDGVVDGNDLAIVASHS